MAFVSLGLGRRCCAGRNSSRLAARGHPPPTAAPAASSFLVREEGMAAIEGKIAKAGRSWPARAQVSRRRLIGIQVYLLRGAAAF
jgi:hypothetical protein